VAWRTLEHSLGEIQWLGLALTSASVALLCVIVTVATQVIFRKRRLRRFHEMELLPNILLTRHPILFIGRQRSLFRLSGDFLELPIFLREHGYQVEEVEIKSGWHSHREIEKSIIFLLDAPKTHVFLPYAFRETAIKLAFDGHPGLASLTVIGGRRESLKVERIHLRPPRVPLHLRADLAPKIAKSDFRIENSALDHVVSLAESDFR
jgi:hypothetical protein